MSRKLGSFSFVFQTVASEMLPHSPNVAASLEIVFGGPTRRVILAKPLGT